MNKFNKLYNFILESIITQNSASRKAMLLKNDIGKGAAEQWIKYLTRLNNNKLADFLCQYVADGTIEDGLDKRIDMVQKILKLNPSLDTQSYKGSLDQFIKQHETIIKKAQAKQAVKTIQFLDSFPEFSQKRTYKYGIVTYKVQNSKDGQEAVRKIIDLQWGEDCNPWCLVSRNGDGLNINYRHYWVQTYNAYPKAIAFQNGKLLAFSANGNDELIWWDRQDKATTTLKLLDGKEIKTKPYKFKDLFEKYNDLRFNRESGRYDYGRTLKLKNEDLVDGHIPIPLGVIKLDFDCSDCTELIDLTNGPTDVVCDFSLKGCQNLRSLAGGPENVGGSIFLESCNNLETLQGGPDFVGGSFICNYMNKLKSLKGAPKQIKGSFRCFSNKSLSSLQGSPKFVAVDFLCCNCPSLTSLEGAPEKVKRVFDCHKTAIKNLVGAPKEVGNLFDCSECNQLETLDGAPEYVRGLFQCNKCPKLKVSKMYGARFKIPSNE